MPAPAIAAAVLRGTQAVRAAARALNETRNITRRAKQVAQARRAKAALESKIESSQRMAKKLKQLKRIGWLIKGVTLGTSSMGDVFFSLGALLFWSNMELIVFPIIIPWWKQEWWEKAITIIIDLIIFSVVLMIVMIPVYLYTNPAEACSLLGEVTGNIFLKMFDLVGGCRLAGGVVKYYVE